MKNLKSLQFSSRRLEQELPVGQILTDNVGPESAGWGMAGDPQRVFGSLNLMTSDELNYQSTEWARSAVGDLPTE